MVSNFTEEGFVDRRVSSPPLRIPLFLGEMRGGNFLVYCPERDVAFTAAHDVWLFIKHHEGELVSRLYEKYSCESFGGKVITWLEDRGLLAGSDARQSTSAERPDFSPHTLIVLPTARCNLRCAYCFSHGGVEETDIQPEYICSAINFVTDSIGQRGGSWFRISFLGGGEPTLKWPVVKKALSHARIRTQALGLELKQGITTNGTWSRSIGEEIANQFSDVTVSIDGTESVMAAHRPASNGKNVYDVVVKNIKLLVDRGCSVKVRSTVSSYSLEDMTAAVELFASLGVNAVHFEPLAMVGRAKTSLIQAPGMKRFYKRFLEAEEHAGKLDISISSSFSQGKFGKSRFCTVPERVVCLTPTGRYTACHRAADDLAGAGIFHYGEPSDSGKSVVYDRQKWESFRNATAATPDDCKHCIASVRCRNGCYYNQLMTKGNVNRPDREWCEISRDRVSRIIENKTNKVQ